jgi:RNA polymerase sigma-B factor
MAHDSAPRTLTDSHRERMLFRHYAETRDPQTRELIVKRHLGLAASVASRYSRGRLPYDDCMQLACVGLLKAIDRYDPDRGTAFSSFAVPTMVGELKRHVRDHTWMVRPPRELQDRVQRLDRVAAALGAELGRAPTAHDLARATDLSLEDVLETLEAARARDSTSLDQPAGPDQDATLATTIGDEDARYGLIEDRILADDLLCELTTAEQRVVRLRFHHDLTQSQIAMLLGCSQTQVSRILRAALDRLSNSVAAERSDALSAV